MGGPFRKILISRTIRVVRLVVVPSMKFLRELSSELPGDSVVEYRPPLGGAQICFHTRFKIFVHLEKAQKTFWHKFEQNWTFGGPP